MSNWKQLEYDPSINGWHKGVIDGLSRGGYAKNYFFADSFKTYSTAFAKFFSSIHVYRYDEYGEPIKDIEVPIKFGPRTKAFDYRVERETSKKYYIALPNITFRYSSYQFDAERASGLNETRTFYSQFFEHNGISLKMQNKFWSDIQPQPYNIGIALELKTEYLSDADQIVQQVLAQFTPDRYFNVKEFWFCNMRRSIQVELNDISQDVQSDAMGEEQKREITTTFNFTIKGWIYKPIEIGYIIDQINVKLTTDGNTTHIWQNSMSGNVEGNEADQNSYFYDRYDFGKIYGTKVGRMSAVVPESMLPVYEPETSGFYTKIEYKELPDITNYPWGSRQLYATYERWDPQSAFYNQVTDDGKPNDAVCKELMIKSSTDLNDKYIFDVSYDEGFGAKNDDQKANPRGGTVIKAWKDLSGYGDFVSDINVATWKFDYKTVDLGTKFVSAAPIITSAGILTENK